MCYDYILQAFKYEEDYQSALEGFSMASKLDPTWPEPIEHEKHLMAFLSNVSELTQSKVGALLTVWKLWEIWLTDVNSINIQGQVFCVCLTRMINQSGRLCFVIDIHTEPGLLNVLTHKDNSLQAGVLHQSITLCFQINYDSCHTIYYRQHA